MRIEKNTTALMDGARVLSREPNGAMPPQRAIGGITSEVEHMDVICPVCGTDAASHFYRHGNEIVGCDCCVVIMEPYELGDDDAI
jgi:hypothetical protein